MMLGRNHCTRFGEGWYFAVGVVDNEWWMTSYAIPVMKLSNLFVYFLLHAVGRRCSSSLGLNPAIPVEVDGKNRQVVLAWKMCGFRVVCGMIDIEHKMDSIPPLDSNKARIQSSVGRGQALLLNQMERLLDHGLRGFPSRSE